jgi:hypothetical protein
MTMTRPSAPQPAPSSTAHSQNRVSAGTAVCIGLSTFVGGIAPEQEPPTDAWRDLQYAGPVTKDLAAALADLGFECTVYADKDLPTARDLGSCIGESLTASPSSGAHIVHVLSHGHSAKSGVYVVGADGKWAPSTKVETWVASIEDDPRPAATPYLVRDRHLLLRAGCAPRLAAGRYGTDKGMGNRRQRTRRPSI